MGKFWSYGCIRYEMALSPHCRYIGSVSLRRLVMAMLSATLLGACARMDIPRNDDANLYDPEKTASTSRTPRGELTYSNNSCPPPGTPNYLASGRHGPPGSRRRRMPPMRYSPGDRFSVLILGSPEFSGDYAVNVDGNANLPYVGSIPAVGLTNAQLTHRIKRRLTNKGLFTAEAGQVSVHPVQYAPINVTIAGAVFNPGRHVINSIKDKEKLDTRRAKTGDSPMNRFIPAAIIAAGGVRPDADLTNVTVHRNGKRFKLDWRGAISGHPVDDMPLIESDHIEVGEAGCFQSALVRPSQITPAGVRFFASNLTIPALSNTASVQNQEASAGTPYGTRLLKALVQANCVGGNYATNARRVAVLISRNPKTRKTEVIQRSIEKLVRSPDRDMINPFIMPEDALVCYDSSVTEFRDVMSIIYGTILPVKELSTF